MLRNLPVLVAAIGLFAQSPDVLEGRKRVQELNARTYVRCGTTDFRLVEDRTGPAGSQQFKVVEYQNPILSGYKLNRFSCLAKSPRSSWESDG